MKKKSWILAILATVLLICFTVPQALAYFTDQARGEGVLALTLGDKTEIQESFKEWVKHISITNEKESMPVWIRCRAYAGVTYDLTTTGAEWTEGTDGWWYYNHPVPGGGNTEDLDVAISGIPTEDLEESSFNVAIVYESIPVRYNEDGSARPWTDEEWNQPLDTGTETNPVADDNTTNGGES